MKPKVQSTLLADHVYKDEFTGKFIVSGIIDTFRKLVTANATVPIPIRSIIGRGTKSSLSAKVRTSPMLCLR
jgi:hypothetical protein